MTKIRVKKMVAIVACFAAIALAPPAIAAGDAELVLAMDAANDHRYGLALAHFKRAGAQGNLPAQRSAGLMLLKGEALYGDEIRTDRAEALRWLTLAADNGCGVSKFVLARSTTAAGKLLGLGNNGGDRSL